MATRIEVNVQTGVMTEVELTQAELDEIAARPAPVIPQDQLDAADAKRNARLQAIMNLRPAQVQGWAASNINTLADARDAIASLAMAVSVLARRM